MSLRLDGYVRVSRVGGREGEGYISPAVQHEEIESYAAELDGQIVAWHQDEDYSGGNVERPDFQAALERLRDRASDGIVVMRVDRFARSVADGAAIVREITDAGQVFASCHERIDPRTPEGKYMLNSFLNNAELFLNQTKAGWWTAKVRAVARGAQIGPTPIGYVRTPKGEPDSGTLTPDPTYGPAITKLFERARDHDAGDTALARWMTKRAPRAGGAPFQPAEIRRWISNRVYLGEVHYGGLVNTEAHPALTDPETWGRCQRAPGAQRRAHSKFLLTGLIRCAACRYAMGGFTYGGRGKTPVYRCGRARNGGCDAASVITTERLDSHVRDLVLDRLGGLELQAAGEGLDLAALDQEFAAAEAELQTFAADVGVRRTLGEAGWQDGFYTRAADRDAKREARDRAYSQSKLVAVARDVEDLDHDGPASRQRRSTSQRKRRGLRARARGIRHLAMCHALMSPTGRSVGERSPHHHMGYTHSQSNPTPACVVGA